MALAGVLVATGLVVSGLLTSPTLAAATSKRSREGAVGGSLGVVQGFGSLGQVGGLLMAGPLYEMGGGGLTFGIGGLASMVLAGCLILVASGSQPPQRPAVSVMDAEIIKFFFNFKIIKLSRLRVIR